MGINSKQLGMKPLFPNNYEPSTALSFHRAEGSKVNTDCMMARKPVPTFAKQGFFLAPPPESCNIVAKGKQPQQARQKGSYSYQGIFLALYWSLKDYNSGRRQLAGSYQSEKSLGNVLKMRVLTSELLLRLTSERWDVMVFLDTGAGLMCFFLVLVLVLVLTRLSSSK